MRFLPRAALAAVLFLIVAPAFAAETTVPTAGILDFIQPYILTALSVIVTAIIGWLGAYLKAKWGIEIDAAHSQAIQDAATNAAGLLLNKARGAVPATVDLKNPLLAMAVNYVAAAVPAAVEHFGLTPEKIAQKILAKIPQLQPPAAPGA